MRQKLASIAAIFACVIGSSAWAQDQTTEKETEIVVVGSRVRAKGPSSSPILVFSKSDIDRTGAATVQQFLEKLPQNFGNGANAGNVANSGLDRDVTVNDGRGSSTNLRGLGTGTTLTLLNGRRITASNQFQYVDVSLIPVSAIERVEVLTDGASAIYGTDAIGGVVNIVLRDQFEGLEALGRFGTVTQGGLQEYQAGLTGGLNWAGGHMLLSYEHLTQTNLEATDKPFSQNAVGRYDLYPRSERNSVYGSLSQQLSAGLVLEIGGIYSKRDVRAFRGTTVDFETNVPSTEQYDVTAGLRYDLPADWQVRLTGAFGRSKVVNTGFRTSGTGAISPSSQFRIKSDSRYVDIAADGPILTLPAGEVKAALGGTYRREEYERNSTSGTVVQPPTIDARNIASVFGEVVVPVVGATDRLPGISRLDVTAAVRYDDYSDFGSTTNPKVGIVWEITPGFLARGTYGTSFRAPLFQDLAERSASVVVASLPDPAAPSGRTILLIAQGGNAALEPERATTWTAGVELQPKRLPGFALKLNYYNIKFTDRIDRGFPGSFPTFFQQDTAPFASILTRNPSRELIDELRNVGLGGSQFLVVRVGPFAVPAGQNEFDAQAVLDNRLRNNAAVYQDGLDFDARYGMDVGSGRLDLSFAGQYILSGSRRLTPTSPTADVLNQAFLPVDFKFRAGAVFSRRSWSAAAFVNHVDGYRDLANTTDPHVDAWRTVDVNIRYATPASATGVLAGLSLALNIQNLLDDDPPFVVTQSNSGFDPVNANPLGRFVSFTVTKRW